MAVAISAVTDRDFVSLMDSAAIFDPVDPRREDRPDLIAVAACLVLH